MAALACAVAALLGAVSQDHTTLEPAHPELIVRGHPARAHGRVTSWPLVVDFDTVLFSSGENESDVRVQPTAQQEGRSGQLTIHSSQCAHATGGAAAEVVGVAGIISATLLFVAPFGVMRDVLRHGDIRLHTPLPYLVGDVMAGLWIAYGEPNVTPCKPSVLVINTIGVVLFSTYSLLFLVYAGERQGEIVIKMYIALVTFLLFYFFGTAVAPALAIQPMTHRDGTVATKASTVLGVICAAFNILMFASPLAVTVTVIRTRSVEFLPLALTLGQFLCCSTWLLYAMIAQDIFILLPNAAGLFLAGLQLTLYAMFRPHYSDGSNMFKGSRAEKIVTELAPELTRPLEPTSGSSWSMCDAVCETPPSKREESGLAGSLDRPSSRVVEI